MTPDQAEALRKPFEPHQIGKLPRSNIMLDYVGHAGVTDRLLKVDPEWSWEPVAFTDEGLPKISVRGEQATMWIKLTVAGVTRFGIGNVAKTKADVEKELISDALRNAAMRFGVALDLWSKEELWDAPAGVDPETGEVEGKPFESAHPVATGDSPRGSGGRSSSSSSSGPRAATDKQRYAIDKLVEERGLPDGEWPWPLPGGLSMRAASEFLDALKAMPEPAPNVRAGNMEEVKAAAEKLRDEFQAEYAAGEEPF